MLAAEQACSAVVSMTKEALIKWAEHVFWYMFQSDVAVGAFMPPHQAEQNIPFPMVFRCSVERLGPLETYPLNRSPPRRSAPPLK